MILKMILLEPTNIVIADKPTSIVLTWQTFLKIDFECDCKDYRKTYVILSCEEIQFHRNLL